MFLYFWMFNPGLTEMKILYSIILFIFFSLIADTVKSEALVINGIYQGKDLYVKNPFSDDGAGFCVFEVIVNGEITKDEINSSAFAIDFNIMGINSGTDLEVIIRHKSGCAPLVLNPEAIKPHSTFNITDIKVSNNVLSWTSSNESGSLPYIVEQFRWNKWVKTGEVMGNGKSGDYQFKLTPYSGENKVRIKQVDYTTKPRYSEAVVYNPKVSDVTFSPKQKVEGEISFSAETKYEIFDIYGNLVETGFGKSVDVSNLERKQEYYLNYDSSFGETFKMR